jgi:hypothetical protein
MVDDDITEAKSFEDLCAPAKQYVRRIEELCGVAIGMISVGPDRDQTIVTTTYFHESIRHVIHCSNADRESDDISYRAIKVLESVDFILCEDTRRSIKLLNHYNIKKQLISYHKFNETASVEHIISRLRSGDSGALISDAGTPLISDPGIF